MRLTPGRCVVNWYQLKISLLSQTIGPKSEHDCRGFDDQNSEHWTGFGGVLKKSVEQRNMIGRDLFNLKNHVGISKGKGKKGWDFLDLLQLNKTL